MLVLLVKKDINMKNDILKTLEFYSWLDRCLFPDDLFKDLTELGMDKFLARMVVNDLFRSKKLTIIKCFEYFGNDKENLKILSEYIQNEKNIYDSAEEKINK